MIEETQWARFLDQISMNANVGAACSSSGISRSAFYKRKGEDEEFAAVYQEALEHALDRLEAAAFKRAVEGVEESYTTAGGNTVTTVKYSDGLLQFLLKAHRPGKFKDKTTHELTGPDGQPLGPAVVVVPALDPNQQE